MNDEQYDPTPEQKREWTFRALEQSGYTRIDELDAFSKTVNGKNVIVDLTAGKSFYFKDGRNKIVTDDEAGTLKGAYEIITGKPAGDMNGAESVKLWMQYKASGDESILQRIREYNLEDCRKTLELYHICHEYCSPRDMKPEVL